MAEAAINLTTGQKADRKLDMIFVNVGGSGTETWELLGRGVEDASVEYNHDTDTVTDILGITDVNVSAAKPELDLDPCTIRGGQKLSAKLLDIEHIQKSLVFGREHLYNEYIGGNHHGFCIFWHRIRCLHHRYLLPCRNGGQADPAGK